MVLLGFGFGCSQPTPTTLAEAMRTAGVSTALVLPSQAIDEYPVWSPDQRYMGVNVKGTWLKLPIDSVTIKKVYWRDMSIGQAIATQRPVALSTDELAACMRASSFQPREITTRSGIRIELRSVEMSTRLVITRTGKPEETIWTSGGENCHSLVLSPDQTHVAYLCELNGLLVMRIE